jgi:hypothetical protein
MNPMMLVQMGIGVVDGITNLVSMFEAPGKGPEKKEAVKKMALAGLATTLALMNIPVLTSVQEAQISIAIEGMIDTVVGFKNLVGAFSHSTPAK